MSNTDLGNNLNPPMRSKINWTQLVGFAAIIGTYFGVDMPAEVQAAAATLIGSAVMVATWVFRTWFTG